MTMLFNRRFMIIAAIYILICLIIDFFPTFGPPPFRYTGSDPTVDVWNLGWPLATAVWDPKYGLHIGPFFYVFIPIQLFIAALSFGIILLVRYLKQLRSLKAFTELVKRSNW